MNTSCQLQCSCLNYSCTACPTQIPPCYVKAVSSMAVPQKHKLQGQVNDMRNANSTVWTAGLGWHWFWNIWGCGFHSCLVCQEPWGHQASEELCQGPGTWQVFNFHVIIWPCICTLGHPEQYALFTPLSHGTCSWGSLNHFSIHWDPKWANDMSFITRVTKEQIAPGDSF